MEIDDHEHELDEYQLQYEESQLCIAEGDYDAAYELLYDLLQVARRKKVDFEKHYGKMTVAMPEGEIKELARAICFELGTASHELAKLHDIEGDFESAVEQFDLAVSYFNWSQHFGTAKCREAKRDAMNSCVRHQLVCGREALIEAFQPQQRRRKSRKDTQHAD